MNCSVRAIQVHRGVAPGGDLVHLGEFGAAARDADLEARPSAWPNQRWFSAGVWHLLECLAATAVITNGEHSTI
jgi:hypothetical protein